MASFVVLLVLVQTGKVEGWVRFCFLHNGGSVFQSTTVHTPTDTAGEMPYTFYVLTFQVGEELRQTFDGQNKQTNKKDQTIFFLFISCLPLVIHKPAIKIYC